MKLSKEELEEVQSINTDYTKKKIMLGDLEIQKAAIVSEIGSLKIKFAQNEK